jgi:hypothetical protein
MPFGQHKGMLLQDCPARYLTFLWRDGLHEFSSQLINENAPPVILRKQKLANYIWNSQDAIAKETGERL